MSSLPALFPDGCSSGPDYLTGWDTCTIGGIQLPGKCQVGGAAMALKIDKKKANGSHGGKPTTSGIDAQAFTVRVDVWTDSQLDLLAQAVADLAPRVGTSSDALNIKAPQLLALGIKDVIVQKCGQFEPSTEFPGGKSVTITLQHFVPPSKKSAVTTPKVPKRNINNVRAEGPESTNPSPAANQSIADPAALQSLP